MAEIVERRDGCIVARIGPCMVPTYADGQEIEFVPAPSPFIGMIALIRAREGHVIHRVLDVHDDWVIHGGDAVPGIGVARTSEIVGTPAVRAVEVGGGSMEPSIPAGSVALVENRPPRRGEVGLFWSGDRPLVHRVADAAGGWYVHASDATGEAGFAAAAAGRILAKRLPASRRAHLLGLALRLWVTLHHLGLPPFREGFRAVKKMLLSLAAPSRIP